MVPRCDGTIHITVNYKLPNALSVVGKRLLRQIDELIDSLGKSKVVSAWDLCRGFHQIAINPDSATMTASITRRGLFQFLRTPQGHADTPSTFVRLVQCVTTGLESIRMYLDDDIVLDSTPALEVKSIKALVSPLEVYLKFSPGKSHV